MPQLMRNDIPVGKLYRNGVPFFGGASGGSPTPSSGYVENNLCFHYSDNNSNPVVTTPDSLSLTLDENSASNFSYRLSDTEGITVESHFVIYGSGGYTYPRIIRLNESYPPIEIAVGIGRASNADYNFNPMLSMLGSSFSDYEVEVENVAFNQKYTFTAVIDTTGVRHYLDGVLFNTRAQTDETDHISGAIQKYIVYGNSSSHVPNGVAYDIRLYNRALTADEIAANHANDVALYGGNS